MKISLNWLRDFVTLTENDPEAIARRVTTGTAEVDKLEILGGLLQKCCVGKVLTIKKHPNADRLSICEVQTDEGKKVVVCGGTNLRESMCVAFAHVGATVRWHGAEMMTLEKTKIRGVESQGMICAAAELDLASRFPSTDERTIIDLGDSDDGVGQPLKEYLGLDDVVLHIDNHAITHRADLFSHVGFAREFVALGLAKWKSGTDKPAGRSNKSGKISFSKAPLPFKCIVDRKDLVPRYCSCLLEIEGLGETPLWMRKRLEATGWRCVSLPVDITNYVAMETGMPLHSFDADDIRGDFHMRASAQGEKITTLDGVVRVLPEGAIVLSDKEGIFDLLGIMGGLRSSTKPSTRRVYLHAAIADPVAIRKAIIATGHRTDASTVYEKGIPREAASRGILRAVELFTELVPGCTVASQLEEWGDDGEVPSIDLPLARVASMLGVDISTKKIVKILEDLEFTVTEKNAKSQKPKAKKGEKSSLENTEVLSIIPPLHRLGDVRGAHDLIEEIGRIAGYNEIPAQMPLANIDPPRRDMRVHRLRDALKESKYVEIVPISLIGEALLKKSGLDPSLAVHVQNPISEDLRLLQTSTLPGLLEHAQRNMLQASGRLQTFHLAHVFEKGEDEHPELGILLANPGDATPDRALLDTPLLALKSHVLHSLHILGYEANVAVAGTVPPYAHPGRFAEILVRSAVAAGSDEAGLPYTRIGTLFELHPSVASSFDLHHRTAAGLIDLSALWSVRPAVTVPVPVPQFPPVSYDYTETFRHTQSVGDLLRHVRGSHEFLESVSVKDLYTGKNLGKDQYNLTLTFVYRAKDRTLTEDEAKKAHEKVLEKVPA